jgi:hypothetical protein
MLRTTCAPVDHGWKIVEVLLKHLETLFPGVSPAYFKYSNFQVDVLEHFGVLANLKGTQFIYFIIA